MKNFKNQTKESGNSILFTCSCRVSSLYAQSAYAVEYAGQDGGTADDTWRR